MDELAGLATWLAEGGAQHDALVMRSVAGLRGVYALRPIAAGTVIAAVPRRLLLTRHLARGSSIGRQIRDAGLELWSDHALLAAWLLLERRDPRSPYQPYFASLPRDLTGFPIHATAAELELLAGSLAGELVDELRAGIDRDYAALQARVRLFRPIGREEFTWARLCVGSRVFGVTIDGVETTALVPFGDMLNHKPGEVSWRYDQAVEAFTLTALRDFAPGEEVCSDYGPKGNSQLLVQYGFCLEENEAAEAELRFPQRFRPTGHLLHTSAVQMLDWLHQQYRNAAAARAALAAAALAALARFSTTATDDDALLARSDLSSNARHFIRARRSEKRVLLAWLARSESEASVT